MVLEILESIDLQSITLAFWMQGQRAQAALALTSG